MALKQKRILSVEFLMCNFFYRSRDRNDRRPVFRTLKLKTSNWSLRAIVKFCFLFLGPEPRVSISPITLIHFEINL